jgi:hypothetical protein
METPQPLSIITQATSLSSALIEWGKDGFATVPKEVFEKRMSICKLCPLWNQDGFAGLGKCSLCGCSVTKLYLPASKCPLKEPNWLPYEVSA